MDNLPVLLEITKESGLFKSSKITTGALAKKLGVSQQTVSRKLRELESDGFIHRISSQDGVIVTLNDKARDYLNSLFSDLNIIFNPVSKIQGKIVNGLGEGKYYVKLKGYEKQFLEKLGFKPYAGTLNLEVDIVKLNGFLFDKKKITIDGFDTKERSYGSIDAYEIKLNKKRAVMIFPKRTSHGKNIVEVIAPFCIRKQLSLSKGDKVVLN